MHCCCCGALRSLRFNHTALLSGAPWTNPLTCFASALGVDPGYTSNHWSACLRTLPKLFLSGVFLPACLPKTLQGTAWAEVYRKDIAFTAWFDESVAASPATGPKTAAA